VRSNDVEAMERYLRLLRACVENDVPVTVVPSLSTGTRGVHVILFADERQPRARRVAGNADRTAQTSIEKLRDYFHAHDAALIESIRDAHRAITVALLTIDDLRITQSLMDAGLHVDKTRVHLHAVYSAFDSYDETSDSDTLKRSAEGVTVAITDLIVAVRPLRAAARELEGIGMDRFTGLASKVDALISGQRRWTWRHPISSWQQRKAPASSSLDAAHNLGEQLKVVQKRSEGR
jgi:hypothetical protein